MSIMPLRFYLFNPPQVLAKVNPLAPAELVIDHSVIADFFGTADAFEKNVDVEYERNRERYRFLRWGQTAFDEFKVVPPGTGIAHQVNIEYLARVIMTPKKRMNGVVIRDGIIMLKRYKNLRSV